MGIKSRKKEIAVFISLLIMAAGACLPSMAPFTERGIAAMALVLALIILIATSALPIGLMCFICILAQPLMGITASLAESAAYWANYLFFFVILAFAIGIAFANTTISRRVLFFMLKHVKRDEKGPLLAIWLTTALLSGIIANFAIIALMLAFCWEYLDLFDDESDRKRTGRCLLIGMCCATELGGNITPLGSSINMMVINMMEQNGFSLSYIQWILLSAPLFALLFPLAAIILFTLYKPASLSQEKIQICIESNALKVPLEGKEKRLLVICGVMLMLLLVSPLFPVLKSELIIVAAGIILLMPGIGVAEYDQLAKSEAFTQTMYICCFIGLAGILSDAGVVQVITDGFQSLMSGSPSVFIVVAFVCVLTIGLCNFLPAASVPSVLTVPMILFSVSAGINPVLVVIPLAMCSNCSWILPLDPIALLTFGRGYYTLGDMVRAGLLLTAMTAAVTGGWMLLASRFV